MKPIIRNLLNAIKLAVWAYRNPKTLNHLNFKMLSDLLVLILKVAQERRPMMTRLAYLYPETGEDCEIVSIWAGAGMTSSPTKRISELLEENAKLKFQLSEKVSQQAS